MEQGSPQPHTLNSLIASQPLRHWFLRRFPQGPTPIQLMAWPVIARHDHCLVISPTGTGKTLAGFIPVLDQLLTRQPETIPPEPPWKENTPPPAENPPGKVRCVYISPQKSLCNDIEKSLLNLLAEVGQGAQVPISCVAAARTGDTTPYFRQKMRAHPPDILITTPESLSLLLTQQPWAEALRHVQSVIIDEIHGLAPNKRGSDLALTLERLEALCTRPPQRIGISATCRPSALVGQFLVGPGRLCHIVEPPASGDRSGTLSLEVRSIIAPDESAYRPLVLQRMVEFMVKSLARHGSSVFFTNTRPMAERLAFLLREHLRRKGQPDDLIDLHHGSLSREIRKGVEERLKSGQSKLVISSTSLELGVDYDSADFVALVGQPGTVTRCLQRFGRAGHGPERNRHGVILAAHPGELAAAVVTAHAVREGRIEELRTIDCPLDVLSQQILAIACLDDAQATPVYELVKRAWPFRDLSRPDFDACLNYLAGDLPAPAGAYQKEEGTPPRWTSPRLWKSGGHFGVRNRRVIRWFRMNCGTIYSEESLSVETRGRRIGQLEQPYADTLKPGDLFCLDGRTLEFKRIENGIVIARDAGGDSMVPQWTSERPGLSAALTRALVAFREDLGRLVVDDPARAELWLSEIYQMRPADALCLVNLWQRQLACSEVPTAKGVLIEIYPENDSLTYAFHCPLHRPASEALGRAMAARFAARRRHDMRLAVTDLGFVIQGGPEGLSADDLRQMFTLENLRNDVVQGLDKGELVARRFRAAAATGLMVLKNAEGRKPRVGGQDWVSQRLFPVVREACPDHPLLREAQREALEQILDLPALAQWLETGPAIRIRKIRGISPFTTAWLEPFGREGSESIQVETPDEALTRLHQRLFGREGNFVA